jgi:type II secretory pathway component PulF
MTEFQYHAMNREGRPVAGRVEADDVEQAVARLSEQGLSVRAEDLIPLEDGPHEQQAPENAAAPDEKSSPRLSGRETTQLVETVVDLTSADLPLSAGLRATAEEIPQRRLATAMERVAAELDRGVSLDVALEAASKNVPSHLRGLILAGLRTGRVAHVLEELVAMDRERIDLRRRIAAALAYPTILFMLLLGAFIFANLFIVRPFSRIFDEFGVDLPNVTLMMISLMYWLDHSGLWNLAILLGIVLPAFAILLVIPKPPDLQRACYQMPIIGPLWRWQSLVDFSRLMHLLLDRQIPVADALRLTADGLRWSDLAAVCRACAADVEKGMGLCESMAKHREFPASIHPVIESGIRTQQPGEAFGAAADMYRRRAGVDATLWEVILPPFILVLVSVGIGFLVLAMMLPLFSLLSSLT